MFGYQVPDPDEAMLISGGRADSDDAPFRVVVGRGTWVMPFFRQSNFLTLAMQEALLEETCVTQQGIAIQAKAVCAFKVANDDASIVSAAQRFLSDQSQMSLLTGRIFAGHLRSIIGAMTVEEIVRERQKLAQQVLDASKPEIEKLGLLVDSFQISSIDDQGSGYIAAMAAPHNAAIQRDAKIAEAEANRLSVEAEQESERKQSEYVRETSIVQAKNKADVDQQTAVSEQAGPLAQAEAQQAVTDKQTALAERRAKLREQELQSEIVKPAQAKAAETTTLAKADADATKLRAEAAASHNSISLDQLLIEQLPTIVEKAGLGLAKAQVNLLEGSDGLAQVTAGLLSQGKVLFDTARAMRLDEGEVQGNGHKPAPVTAS